MQRRGGLLLRGDYALHFIPAAVAKCLVAVSEILAKESASAGLCFAMHCVGTAVIAAKATPVQRERYLDPIARGQHITTLALSEPGSGSFFFYPSTALDRTPHGFRIDGTKSFVTNGSHADSFVCSTAPIAGEGEEGQFNCVLVEREAAGIEWLDAWHGLGMRSNDSRTLRLEGVEIPHDNLLGAVGDQLWYIFEVVAPYFLMAMAGTYLGVAQAAFDEAREHVGTRRYSHSGELLGAAPVVSHGLMYIRGKDRLTGHGAPEPMRPAPVAAPPRRPPAASERVGRCHGESRRRGPASRRVRGLRPCRRTGARRTRRSRPAGRPSR